MGFRNWGFESFFFFFPFGPASLMKGGARAAEWRVCFLVFIWLGSEGVDGWVACDPRLSM